MPVSSHSAPGSIPSSTQTHTVNRQVHVYGPSRKMTSRRYIAMTMQSPGKPWLLDAVGQPHQSGHTDYTRVHTHTHTNTCCHGTHSHMHVRSCGPTQTITATQLGAWHKHLASTCTATQDTNEVQCKYIYSDSIINCTSRIILHTKKTRTKASKAIASNFYYPHKDAD